MMWKENEKDLRIWANVQKQKSLWKLVLWEQKTISKNNAILVKNLWIFQKISQKFSQYVGSNNSASVLIF